MRKSIILIVCFAIMLVAESAWGVNLSGKLALSTKGGLCYSMGDGLDSYAKTDGRFGVGVSAEYFIIRPLSVGLTLVHNSFEGEWTKSHYYADWGTWYYNDWNWTNISLFVKFVMAPREEASPYFTAGVGAYIPRSVYKWYDHPDTVHTHTSQGGRYFGIHLGFGVHYFISQRALVFLDVPLNLIRTDFYRPQDLGRYHDAYDCNQILNVFVGLSFLLGSEKHEKEKFTGW
jgi:hypothetical protein